MNSINPIIKIAGGKKRFREQIAQKYHQANSAHNKEHRWVDLFAGGLSIPLYLNPKEVLINDLNPYLINLYLHVAIFGKLDQELFINEEEHYYRCRNEFNELIADKQWQGKLATHATRISSLYYYLNRAGFNGLSRFSKAGKFNTPFGRYKYTKFETDFSQHQKLFKKWEIKNLNYEDCYNQYSKDNPNDFVFSDPPYWGTWGDYTTREFTWEDQVKLAQILANHPGPVMATNSAHEQIINLYSSLGFKIDIVNRTERIGGKTEKIGKVAQEIHATKNIL